MVQVDPLSVPDADARMTPDRVAQSEAVALLVERAKEAGPRGGARGHVAFACPALATPTASLRRPDAPLSIRVIGHASLY